jgi:hypothetical protein
MITVEIYMLLVSNGIVCTLNVCTVRVSDIMNISMPCAAEMSMFITPSGRIGEQHNLLRYCLVLEMACTRVARLISTHAISMVLEQMAHDDPG